MNVETVERPYTLTFRATNTSYPLTREEADRLIAEYPVIHAKANAVHLRGDDGYPVIIRPATLGGGPAFIVHK